MLDTSPPVAESVRPAARTVQHWRSQLPDLRPSASGSQRSQHGYVVRARVHVDPERPLAGRPWPVSTLLAVAV